MGLQTEIFKMIHGYDPSRPFLQFQDGRRINIEGEESEFSDDPNEQSVAEMKDEAEYEHR